MSRFTILGRMVQGDVQKAQPQRKDERTGALKFRKDGQPDCPFFVAVAVEKDPSRRFTIQGVPDYESQKAAIDAAARLAWPDFFKGNAARPHGLAFPAQLHPDCTNPAFSNKIFDGDGFDDKGRPYSENEGWAGCWVIKFSNGFAPEVSEWLDNRVDPRGQSIGAGWEVTSKTGRIVKCGDYISVGGTCETNKSSDSPGMYMNFDTVGFEKEGDAIVQKGGVDSATALGSRGGAASPPNGSAGAASNPRPAHGTTNSATAPAYDGYRTAAADAPPPPPGAGAPPPPPAGPTLTDKATTTYAAYQQAGWTDDQLRNAGIIV